MPEIEIGKVTHYFNKISVAIINLTDTLKVGDTIHIKGHTADFNQTVDSLQIEHKNVAEAKSGESVGTKVSQPVHEHDAVFKVVP